MKPRQLWRYRKVDLRVVERVTEAEARGEVILTVPGWLASEASQWIWHRKVEHSQNRWAKRVAEVTPEQWKQAMYRRLGPDGDGCD